MTVQTIVPPGTSPIVPPDASQTLSTLSDSLAAQQAQSAKLDAAIQSHPTGDMNDTTTGEASSFFLAAYTGPVVGLSYEFIDVRTDNLNLTATTPNVFLHSGSGEDAIQVSSGNNVLDGGTGSNFLVGGTGNDTFFVDDRNAAADIWSTVAGFHSGDNATVWGITAQDFNLQHFDNRGAAGFTGLTFEASAAGKANASLTLPGFTSADLTNGRLSVTFGTDAASGSNYMLVQAK
jgi:Ca2+-binding RTX toxin-like protein